jgi:hypothetical protein
MAKRRHQPQLRQPPSPAGQPPMVDENREDHPQGLPDPLPVTYQELTEYAERSGGIAAFTWRQQTMLRIEAITGRPLIAYVTRTSSPQQGMPIHIDDADLIGFGDLVQTTPGDTVDVFLISNGGSAEATERIVNAIRGKFNHVRFIVPANAYSAATLMCLSGDKIIMDSLSTLGPIDPQLNGIPTRAILRSFEHVKEILAKEGPQFLPAYLPLLNKYDLYTLEICRSVEQLSAELAGVWLSKYMLKCERTDERVVKLVEYFGSYDLHKSHSRTIDRTTAAGLGLEIEKAETVDGLGDLVRSLRNQYELWFDKTPFYKMFENARGINWGRQIQTVQVPPGVLPSSTPPGSARR